MQEVRLAQPGRCAQVDLDECGLGARGEASRPLGFGDVAGERHLGCCDGDRSEFVADHQLTSDEVETTHHGVGSIEHLRQPDPGASAHRGERLGESGSGDEVIRRGRPPAIAHETCCIDEEPCDTVGTRMVEHVAVPARTVDAGGVAGTRCETPMRPRHPGHRGLDLRQPAQGGGVGRDGRRARCIDVEDRDVPRTAHDDDLFVAGAAGGADRSAHVGLALQFPPGRHEAVAGRGHRVGNGVEGGGAVAAVLDHVLPPSFRIGVARRRGEFAQRVRGRRFGHERRLVVTRGCERDRERQVDGVHLDVVGVGPTDRLPFGTERGERGERSPARLGWDVGEQGDRRHQTGLAHPPQRGVDVGGRFDEHHVGSDVVECPQHRPRRPGSVMTDAEQVDAHVSSERQAS